MTTTEQLAQALRIAIETLEELQGGCTDSDDGTVEALTVWCPEVIEQCRAALAQHEAQQAPGTWAQYVAGMIVTYLGANADEDERTQAIASIIERRLWALGRNS